MYSTRQEDGNNTTVDHDDATWVLTNAFTIFTMQSGFGLLESGMASMKTEANIMVKNAVDVIFGGFSYWVFGFAFSFGIFERGNPFCGLGYFLTDAEESSIGQVYSQYFSSFHSPLQRPPLFLVQWRKELNSKPTSCSHS